MFSLVKLGGCSWTARVATGVSKTIFPVTQQLSLSALLFATLFGERCIWRKRWNYMWISYQCWLVRMRKFMAHCDAMSEWKYLLPERDLTAAFYVNTASSRKGTIKHVISFPARSIYYAWWRSFLFFYRIAVWTLYTRTRLLPCQG